MNVLIRPEAKMKLITYKIKPLPRVCINIYGELLVANPSTREVKTVMISLAFRKRSSCWGFGYDSV